MEQEGHLLAVRWFGTLTQDDLGHIFHDLPAWGRRMGHAPDVLHLFDEVQAVTFVFEDLIEHARGRIWTKIPQRVKSAAVGGTPLTSGYARMFRALNANPMIEMEVFETEAEARAWLAESSPR